MANIEHKDTIKAWEFRPGKCFLIRLPYEGELVETLEDFCGKNGIKMAAFSIIGAVNSVTLGAYDQNQQVYVTYKKRGHFEIVHCTGNISIKDEKPTMHAHGVFADMDGNTFGGHVFSKTMVFAGEAYLCELSGAPLTRNYDKKTGLYLWQA